MSEQNEKLVMKEQDIDSLRKEYEEKRQRKGISKTVSETKMKLNFALAAPKLYEKIVAAYAKKLHDLFKGTKGMELARKRIENSGAIKMCYELYDADSPEANVFTSVVQTVNYTARTRPSIEKLKQSLRVYKITLSDAENENLNFSFVSSPDVKLNKKGDNSWRNIKYCRDYIPMHDLGRIAASYLVAKDCTEFAARNKKLIKYLILKLIVSTKVNSNCVGYFKERMESIVPADTLASYHLSLDDWKTCDHFRMFNQTLQLFNMLEKIEKDEFIMNTLEFIHRRKSYEVEGTVINETTSEYLSVNQLSDIHAIMVKIIMGAMVLENNNLTAYEEYVKKSMGDYALSFQTKRNIPKKVLDAMDASPLRKYFSFVEFDESVDLNLMKSIENEMMKINDHIGFGDIASTRNKRDLRFRRLGHHKAGGLYYPHCNCVCIDLDSPGSYIHEMCHMIDHTTYPGMNVSELFEFRFIADRYEELLDDYMLQLDGEHPERKKYCGKSKYNRDYYMMPTEIFARCGEMYFKRTLKMETNLLKSCKGFEYPDDAKLNDLINKFYSEKIFTNVGKSKESKNTGAAAGPGKSVASAQIEVEKEKVEILELKVTSNGQLTLF